VKGWEVMGKGPAQDLNGGGNEGKTGCGCHLRDQKFWYCVACAMRTRQERRKKKNEERTGKRRRKSEMENGGAGRRGKATSPLKKERRKKKISPNARFLVSLAIDELKNIARLKTNLLPPSC